MTKRSRDYPFKIHALDIVCCILFLVEILLRCCVDGFAFWFGENMGWNLFDLAMVVSQLAELLLDAALVTALQDAWASLCFTSVLLLMVIYIFSVVMLQTVAHHNIVDELPDDSGLKYWFRDLFRTMLTMFECVGGGVSWDEVARPLVEEISPAMGFYLCVYIVICLLFILNLVTGIFVEQVTNSAKEERDGLMVRRISELFLSDGRFHHGISRDEFVQRMTHNTMQAYFKAIDVSPADAAKLFELLDVDGSGSVDAEEIVQGCLALRGGSKGVDMHVLRREVLQLRLAVAELVSAHRIDRSR